MRRVVSCDTQINFMVKTSICTCEKWLHLCYTHHRYISNIYIYGTHVQHDGIKRRGIITEVIFSLLMPALSLRNLSPTASVSMTSLPLTEPVNGRNTMSVWQFDSMFDDDPFTAWCFSHFALMRRVLLRSDQLETGWLSEAHFIRPSAQVLPNVALCVSFEGHMRRNF